MTLNPVNTFSNQIILEISDTETETIEQIFPKIIQIVSKKKNTFNENDILEIFKRHLDFKKINCIFYPQSFIPIIQNVYKNSLSRNGSVKLVISQKKLIDIKTTEEENEIIEKTHNRAHRGISENVLAIKSKFFFQKMKQKVSKFVNLCTTCKKAKYDRKPYDIEILEIAEPKKPLDGVHIDIFIDQPNIFLSAVDRFSRFGVLTSIKSRSINDIRNGMFKLFKNFPHPKLLVMDNEPSFKAVEIRSLLERLDIATYFTPVDRSEVNGIVERFHSTIAEIYRCNKNNFDRLTSKSMWTLATSLYNTTISSVHLPNQQPSFTH